MRVGECEIAEEQVGAQGFAKKKKNMNSKRIIVHSELVSCTESNVRSQTTLAVNLPAHHFGPKTRLFSLLFFLHPELSVDAYDCCK